MGLYIKGTEMPESCFNCKFPRACQAITRRIDEMDRTKWFPNDHRHSDCPLVEVPEPHGRLGDLDRLEQMFVDIDNAPYSGFDGEEPFYSAEDAAQIIRLAPTFIPESEEGET